MAQQGERSAHPQTLDFRSYQELSARVGSLPGPALPPRSGCLGHLHQAPPHPIARASHPQLSYLPLSTLALSPLPLHVHWPSRAPHLCCTPGSLWGHLHNLRVHCAGQDRRGGGSLPWHPAAGPDEEVLGPVLPKTIPMVCPLVWATSHSLWVTGWPPRPVTSTEPDEGSLELF